MGVPNVVYKWKSLRTLYVSVFVMNVAGCFIVVIMIVSAVKLRTGVGQYMDTVVPGDGNFWPGIIFLIAFLCAPIYAIGTKLCFHLRYFPTDCSVPRLNQVLFVHCILCLASMILIVGINALAIIHALNISRVNRNGIIESMQEYATDLAAKIRVDMIQISFQCCGSKSFKDWFHVRWTQTEGDTTETKYHNESGAFVSTDVPFSCCATDMLQPCIHHNILKPSEVYSYQPEHRLTIATTGCQAKVLSHARHVGGVLIIGMILLAAYQMVLGLLSRLLQTAHSNASYIGPRKGSYACWILGSMPNPDVHDRLREETLSLQETESDDVDVKCRGSDNEGEKSLGKRHSETLSIVTSLGEAKKSSGSTSCTNSVLVMPKVSGNRLKELRQSLECLEKYKTPWRGGSPISCGSSRVDDGVEGGFESRVSSSEYKNHCRVSGRASTEESRDEMRMKKFCKELSSEYKKSPYSRQRRDFSEEYKRQDPTRLVRDRDDDPGRLIRNEVCEKFNPADTYSRFRGSTQDTVMRRSSQTHPGPPPIPISDQRADIITRPHRLQRRSFLGKIGGDKQGCRGLRCPPAPTYFPISSLPPPRPPRLPPCPWGVDRQSRKDQVQNRGTRPSQFTHNADKGRYAAAGLQPPRFSGC